MGKIKIYSILILVMAIWGGTLISVKILVTQYNPFTLTAARISIAAITLFLLLYFLKKIRLPNKAEWPWIVAASFLGVIFHHLLLSTGLTYTTGVKSSIISGFSPLLTAILAIIFGFNEFKILRLIGFVLGAIGIIIAVSSGQTLEWSITIGDVLIFISFLSQAFSFLVIRKISSSMNGVLLTCYMMIIGGIVLSIIATIIAPRTWIAIFDISNPYIFLLIGTAIFAITFGHTIYNYAITKIGASETAIIGNFNVMFAMLFSALLLNENLHFNHLIGITLIIVGVLFGTGAVEEILYKRKTKIKEDL